MVIIIIKTIVIVIIRVTKVILITVMGSLKYT